LGIAAYGAAAAAAPTPAFDVFVDEEFEDNDDKGQKADKNRVDDRSLRQRLDGGTVRTGLAIIALQGYKETV
jgi:hypothetical protein